MKNNLGNGWYSLVDEVHNCVDSTDAKIKDIGESNGMMCVRVAGLTESLYDQIRAIEEKSLHTCERCGGPKDHLSACGLVRTICSDCLAKPLKNLF